MLKFYSGLEKSVCWRVLCGLAFALGSMCHSVMAQDEAPKAETSQANPKEQPKEQPKVSADDVRKLLKELDLLQLC